MNNQALIFINDLPFTLKIAITEAITYFFAHDLKIFRKIINMGDCTFLKNEIEKNPKMVPCE